MASVYRITTAQFLQRGLQAVGFDVDRQRRTRASENINRFRAAYGAGPGACSSIFRDFQTTANHAARINKPNSFYFLVGMNWLAAYQTEKQMAGLFKCDDKTLRKHIKVYVDAIAALKDEKIVWDIDSNPEEYLISVDGVHFRIHEPRTKPSAKWCSYKFKSAGLAYEIGLTIFDSRVVWVIGPYQAAVHDKEIYESKLKKKIPVGKKVVADRGYRGEEGRRTLSIRNTHDTPAVKDFKRRVRARHENFNARLKVFNILEHRFRHRLERHKTVFDAVCVICQYDMENGHPLFDVLKAKA